MTFSIEEDRNMQHSGACLKVIGVGGGGGNAVNGMMSGSEMSMVEFIVANTDAQALEMSPVQTKIQLGEKITKGLGAGSNPDIGRRSAEEDLDVIAKSIHGADILFLTAGMGGGTGSGALPVIAHIAREMGILTVGIVTKPFAFEGKRRMRHAEEAIKNLKQAVDTLIIVPNQKLLDLVDPKITMLDAFNLSNDILKQAIKGISDIITKPGHINVDFADVRSIMKDMGMALMGVGRMQGENRAEKAAQNAISSPLLEDVSIEGARGVLINITGNTDLGLHEIHEAASIVYDLVSEDANIILGSVIDPEIGDEIMVTVIATGFEHQQLEGGSSNKPQSVAGQTHQASAPAGGYSMHQQSQPIQQQYAQQRPTNAGPTFRSPEQQRSMHQQQNAAHSAFDMKDIDTPAFLRKNVSHSDKTE